jgi:hypothetical protein
MTPHHIGDLLFWLCYLAGQLLHDLKRADIAARKNHGVTKLAFLEANWVILVVRGMLELPLFWVWRHYDVAPLVAKFGYTVPFNIPVNPVSAFLFGFFADSLLDWISTSSKAPAWLKSEIPVIEETKS